MIVTCYHGIWKGDWPQSRPKGTVKWNYEKLPFHSMRLSVSCARRRGAHFPVLDGLNEWLSWRNGRMFSLRINTVLSSWYGRTVSHTSISQLSFLWTGLYLVSPSHSFKWPPFLSPCHCCERPVFSQFHSTIPVGTKWPSTSPPPLSFE
jgi:hypothetical protein